jgi:hypothetical protein
VAILHNDGLSHATMKRRSIEELVYEYMFPQPKPTDPQNWSSFLQRNLVTEVRQETACFYGSLDTREAQYPGLDYSNASHRMRLSRFTWHRRLFRAFDALKLTESEIAGLTHWEGTRWAKERFEREQNVKIRDTTGDCIKDWVDPAFRRPARPSQLSQEVDMDDLDDIEENDESEDADQMDEDGEESDAELESIGVELNQRLRAGFSDEEYEQWLKEAAEAGGISLLPGQSLAGSGIVASGQSATYRRLPSSIVNAILQADRLRNGTTTSAPRTETFTSTSTVGGIRSLSTTSLAIDVRAQQVINALPALRRISIEPSSATGVPLGGQASSRTRRTHAAQR